MSSKNTETNACETPLYNGGMGEFERGVLYNSTNPEDNFSISTHSNPSNPVGLAYNSVFPLKPIGCALNERSQMPESWYNCQDSSFPTNRSSLPRTCAKVYTPRNAPSLKRPELPESWYTSPCFAMPETGLSHRLEKEPKRIYRRTIQERTKPPSATIDPRDLPSHWLKPPPSVPVHTDIPRFPKLSTDISRLGNISLKWLYAGGSLSKR